MSLPYTIIINYIIIFNRFNINTFLSHFTGYDLHIKVTVEDGKEDSGHDTVSKFKFSLSITYNFVFNFV